MIDARDPSRLTFTPRALDFLYMIYKPPRPLTCLITEDILLKYRRIFSLLLRLLRGMRMLIYGKTNVHFIVCS